MFIDNTFFSWNFFFDVKNIFFLESSETNAKKIGAKKIVYSDFDENKFPYAHSMKKKIPYNTIVEKFCRKFFWDNFFFLESFRTYEDSSFIEIEAIFFRRNFVKQSLRSQKFEMKIVLVKRNCKKIGFFLHTFQNIQHLLGPKLNLATFEGRKVRGKLHWDSASCSMGNASLSSSLNFGNIILNIYLIIRYIYIYIPDYHVCIYIYEGMQS